MLRHVDGHDTVSTRIKLLLLSQTSMVVRRDAMHDEDQSIASYDTQDHISQEVNMHSKGLIREACQQRNTSDRGVGIYV